MLLRFSVKNNLSFSKEETISFIASQEKRHPNHVYTTKDGQVKVLRMGAIYGANGAGKSNLLKSIYMAQKMIIQGVTLGQALKKKSFKLDKNLSNEPTIYNFDILINGEILNYGFAHDHYQISEEWLYKIPAGNFDKEDLVFFRKTIDGVVDVKFGKLNKLFDVKDSDFIDYVAKGTRPEQLFLNETVNRNIKAFSDLYYWFKNQLIILAPNARHRKIEVLLKFSKLMPDAMSKFLKDLGTGVDQVFAKPVSLTEVSASLGIPQNIIDQAKSDLKSNDFALIELKNKVFVVEKSQDNELVINQIKTSRTTTEGTSVEFNFSDESHGTQKLIHTFPAINSAMVSNKTILIDEFELNLHPLVSKQIIKNFIDSFDDQKQGQLIFTTHEDNLLDLDLFRKDEIWFVEKDENHSSSIYSLAEFKPRYDLKVNKHYLEGRFGAIPFISSPEQLGWDA